MHLPLGIHCTVRPSKIRKNILVEEILIIIVIFVLNNRFTTILIIILFHWLELMINQSNFTQNFLFHDSFQM